MSFSQFFVVILNPPLQLSNGFAPARSLLLLCLSYSTASTTTASSTKTNLEPTKIQYRQNLLKSHRCSLFFFHPIAFLSRQRSSDRVATKDATEELVTSTTNLLLFYMDWSFHLRLENIRRLRFCFSLENRFPSSSVVFLFQVWWGKSLAWLISRFAIYLPSFFSVSVYCHLLGMEDRSICICLWLNRHLSNGFTDPILIQVLIALEKMYMPELAYWFRDQFLSSLYSSMFTLAI